jgi:hypothetical protein
MHCSIEGVPALIGIFVCLLLLWWVPFTHYWRARKQGKHNTKGE